MDNQLNHQQTPLFAVTSSIAWDGTPSSYGCLTRERPAAAPPKEDFSGHDGVIFPMCFPPPPPNEISDVECNCLMYLQIHISFLSTMRQDYVE